ncbi:MAG: DNA repair protein RadC [Deltaproteobacteria bacterium]|nr:DNA repair protein RadC [Deltaproteobacteria bacterium]
MKKEDWQNKGTGHRQRLRNKFQQKGIEAFTDAEVLELLLILGMPRKDCKQEARALLKQFGSLPSVLEAPASEIQKIKGVGPNNSFAIHFLHAVARRYLRQRLKNKKYIHSSQHVVEYLIHSMRDLKHEVLSVIFLDSAHAIVDTRVVARGTVAANTIYPRELIKLALKFNAAALVLAHNHPSGSLEPSSQDFQLTRTLYLACSFMNIRLLDHLIIGHSDTTYSFADHGIMTRIGEECSRMLEQ